MSFFIWLESTALSEWIRSSPSLWGFPFILYLHTLGLALIAGLSSAVALFIIAVPGPPRRPPLGGLFPLMWLGLSINALSGMLLLIAYPAKALTNPVFYLKLVAIVAAVGIVRWLERRFAGLPAATSPSTAAAALSRSTLPGAAPAAAGSAPDLRRAAWALLGLWLVATTTGRLLAYTHSILLASFAEFM
ncbi:MAG TPA: hypothetical protein VMR74_13570 [Gammaproteobacteria bacterium]|nr:hypothetical protein [Gammaproteobacteria bacterium]